MTLDDALKKVRGEAERMYAFETSPYAHREAKGMARAVDEIRAAVDEVGELKSTFDRRLRIIRTDMDMSRDDMAEYLGITPRVMRMYEGGEKDPGTKAVKEYAEKLGVPFMWLLGYGETFSWGG